MSAFFQDIPHKKELPIKSKWFTFELNVDGDYNIYNKKLDEDIGTLERQSNKNNWVFLSYGKFIYSEQAILDILKAIKYLKGK
jgi:hypothetical protein